MLDDLYWVMSYSRWKDERYWPAFRDALMREHPQLTEEGLLKAKEFNAQRYHYQGIGRYQPDAAMARGLADLGALADLIPANGYVHGDEAHQHRRRHLWVHRQHLFLRHRHAAEAVRRRARQPRAALQGDSSGGEQAGRVIGMKARGMDLNPSRKLTCLIVDMADAVAADRLGDQQRSQLGNALPAAEPMPETQWPQPGYC